MGRNLGWQKNDAISTTTKTNHHQYFFLAINFSSIEWRRKNVTIGRLVDDSTTHTHTNTKRDYKNVCWRIGQIHLVISLLHHLANTEIKCHLRMCVCVLEVFVALPRYFGFFRHTSSFDVRLELPEIRNSCYDVCLIITAFNESCAYTQHTRSIYTVER